MPRLLALLLAALIFGMAAPVALAQQLDGFSECGTVNAYKQASATADGSITIGSRTFVLKADALYSQMGQNRLMIAVGRAICLQGTRDAPSRFVHYGAIALPEPYCGTVVAFRPPASAAGSVSLRELGVATFAIPAGTDAGAIGSGSRICFTLRIDDKGDAAVSSRVLTLAERAAASLSVCGRVSQWSAPERADGRALLVHRAAGSITVGTHTVPIAAGTEYSLVNAPPIVGETTCLSGWLNADGQLIFYGAQPGMYPKVCGALTEFVAPAPARDGVIRFDLSGSSIPPAPDTYTFRVPAGTALPPDAGNGRHCFTLGLDARGDAVVTGDAGAPTPPRVATGSEPRHASGLVVLDGPADKPGSPLPEPLAKAASDAWQLAQANADDLGYAWPDPATGELVLHVATTHGENVARQWIAAGARIATLKGDLVLGAPQVQVRLRTGARSWKHLEQIKDDVTRLVQAGLPDADAIWQAGPDGEHDRVIVTVDRTSDRLFAALASRYGTDAIAIRIEQGRLVSLAAGHPLASAGHDGQTWAVILAGLGAVVFVTTAAALAIRRRSRP